MIVRDYMTTRVKSCTADTDLGTVATMMWDGDCGVVPVISDNQNVVGMITDRDICIAAATRGTSPSNIQVRDVMSGDVFACVPDDDVRTALKIMRDQRVRRLPVIDRDERLAGIVSLNDLATGAECREGANVPGDAFLETLKAICEHTRPTVTA